jgi:hypothetical protein
VPSDGLEASMSFVSRGFRGRRRDEGVDARRARHASA